MAFTICYREFKLAEFFTMTIDADIGSAQVRASHAFLKNKQIFQCKKSAGHRPTKQTDMRHFSAGKELRRV
jgi:hypothetical protein